MKTSTMVAIAALIMGVAQTTRAEALVNFTWTVTPIALPGSPPLSPTVVYSTNQRVVVPVGYHYTVKVEATSGFGVGRLDLSGDSVGDCWERPTNGGPTHVYMNYDNYSFSYPGSTLSPAPTTTSKTWYINRYQRFENYCYENYQNYAPSEMEADNILMTFDAAGLNNPVYWPTPFWNFSTLDVYLN